MCRSKPPACALGLCPYRQRNVPHITSPRSAYARALGFEDDIVWLADEASSSTRKPKKKKKKKKQKTARELVAADEDWTCTDKNDELAESDDVCNVDDIAVVVNGDSGAGASTDR